MSNQIQLRERASYSYCARSWRQQTNQISKPSGWKCYKTVSCAFIKIWKGFPLWIMNFQVTKTLQIVDDSIDIFFLVFDYISRKRRKKGLV